MYFLLITNHFFEKEKSYLQEHFFRWNFTLWTFSDNVPHFSVLIYHSEIYNIFIFLFQQAKFKSIQAAIG